MTLHIDLAPEKEDALREEATRQGVSIHEYVKSLLEENLSTHGNGIAPTPEEEERLLDELVDLGKNLPPSPPGETYSRETIYAESD